LQQDPDTFLRYYKLEPSHYGYRLKGRTPVQALEVNEPLPMAA